MKYKAVIKEVSSGTQIILYKKMLFWFAIDGYKPLTRALFLIDEALDRWKNLFGDNLIIEDCRL